MMTFEQIENASRQLREDELAPFRIWVAEFDAAAWDRQFERDLAVGRLNALADQTLREARGEATGIRPAATAPRR
jgi:hypothetical protein